MLDFSYYGQISLQIVSPIESLDLSDCLKEISWGTQSHEPGTAQVYQGSLTVVLSNSAEARGVTGSDFDQQVRPSLWLDGTSAVLLTLSGTTLRFRINNWSFDRLTKTGKATLTQQLAMYNKSIPQADLAFISPYEISVPAVVYRAADVTNAFANDKITVGSVLPYPGPSGNSTVYGQMSASSLWSESQSLLTHAWGWLSQSLADEKVNAEHLDYGNEPILFVRAASQAIVVADQSVSFVAPRVIAHGSADLPEQTVCKPDANANANGYPKRDYSEEFQEIGIAMPKYSPSTLAIPITSKEVEYFYRVPGRTRSINGPAGIGTQVLSWSPEDKLPMNEQSQLWKTVTTNRKCLGILFPDSYEGVATLWPYERVTETYTERVTELSLGLINAEKFPGLLDLAEFKREKLQTPPADNKCGRDDQGNDVATNYVRPGGVQPVPRPLKTQTFRAEAVLTPAYRPALDFPYVFDIGWCPSQDFAQLVSDRLVIREKSRSTTDQITLPLPKELVAAYCPVFWRAIVGSRMYFADQVQYQITVGSQGEVKAGVNFIGCFLGNATPVVEPPVQALYYGPPANTAEIDLLAYSSINVLAGVPF